MPRRSPFTTVGQRLAQLAHPHRADLHVHSTASDGALTPSQVVAWARQARLCAVALTDHDTLAGIAEARALAAAPLEVIAAVELTTHFANRELHLLGYFVPTDHAGFNQVLARLCEQRRDRFHDFLSQLAAAGIRVPTDRAKGVAEASASLGRRHVAELLVTCGFAATRGEAFRRFVAPLSNRVIPNARLPIEEAITLVRSVGGVASLAHPPDDLSEATFATLRRWGLEAVEVEYPWGRSSAGRRLRDLAGRLDLAVSGGSDCHGPQPADRRIGSHGISSAELAKLRDRCGCPVRPDS
jgi:predicted metal-dependent phosphoesterase TrpH